MKEFQCGTLVPGCDWHTRAEEEAEVMRRAVEHMRETHGETTIRETMIEAIRDAMDVSMARDERVIVYGEDVGFFGGVFRCTQG
ncbi:MAG: DUF1059 domain-containing protein, partial [Mesorhizobium sp.]